MEGYKGKGNGLYFQCRVKRPGHSEERYISNTKSNALETTAMSVVCGGHFAPPPSLPPVTTTASQLQTFSMQIYL